MIGMWVKLGINRGLPASQPCTQLGVRKPGSGALKDDVNCSHLLLIQSNDLDSKHADIALIILAFLGTGERAK